MFSVTRRPHFRRAPHSVCVCVPCVCTLCVCACEQPKPQRQEDGHLRCGIVTQLLSFSTEEGWASETTKHKSVGWSEKELTLSEATYVKFKATRNCVVLCLRIHV